MYIENSSTPVMGVTLSVFSHSDYNILINGLNQLVQADKQLTLHNHHNMEIRLWGAGEVHLKKALTQLKALCPVSVQASSFFTCFRESAANLDMPSVTAKWFAKSPDKLSRFYGYAQSILPIVEQWERDLAPPISNESLGVYLRDEHHWDESEINNIWDAFPEDKPTNFLINATQNVPHMNEIKPFCQKAFRNACLWGALMGEPLRGFKMVLTHAILSDEYKHRATFTMPPRQANQMIPAVRDLVFGLQLLCEPLILEPIYNIKISSPPTYLPAIQALIKHRRGYYEEDTLEFLMPVPESLGLAEELQALTNNTATAELTFSHWSDCPGEIDMVDTPAGKAFQATRKRKGMAEEIPNHFLHRD